MAKTIGQLTQAITIANNDLFVIEQSSQTKKVAASVVRGNLINADIDAAAAIAHSKLANITAGRVLLGNASNVPTATALTGDVTVSNTGVTAIGNAKVVTAMVNDAAITAPKLSGGQTGSAPIYGCRAWVNFNGTRNATDTGASTNGANVLIRASGNVASVLKNGTGDYTITFTTAMPDANYAFTLHAQTATLSSSRFSYETFPSAATAGTFRVRSTENDSATTVAVDSSNYCVTIFR